jgi:hypothetical protein
MLKYESTTYHRNLLHIFGHVRESFPKAGAKEFQKIARVKMEREGGRWDRMLDFWDGCGTPEGPPARAI